MKKLFIFILFLLAGYAYTQNTFTWNAVTGGTYTTAANWTPARTTPLTNDILVFNDGHAYTVTSIPTETIGQLIVTGANTKVSFSTTTASVLTISGGAGTDLSVSAACDLNLTGSAAITISLNTGANAVISGNMVFA
jgi:hypothetical protein